MQRDRDLRQPTPRNLRRSGFVATSVLSVMAIGAVAVSACGGGEGNSAKTPEVAGTIGATNTPIAEATIKPTQISTEIPTIIPTATAAKTESLSPQELISAGGNVSDLFKKGFEGLDVSAISYGDIPQPAERDLQSILDAVSICTGTVPYPYRDDAERQRMDQDVTLLATGVSGFCELAGEASLRLYDATGRDLFKQANMLMETIHNSVVVDFQIKDDRIKDSVWKSLERRFYPFGATGSN